MIVGFDFDGTLNSPSAKKFFKNIANDLNQCKLAVITNRFDVDDEIVKTIKEIGLKEVIVYAIGEADYNNKAAFIAEEELSFDLFFEDSDFEIIKLKSIGISCFKILEAK